MNNDLPHTVELLNGWINAHFAVLVGPPRAYVEFPFPFVVGFDGEDKKITTVHRIVYLTLGFYGGEEECCTALAAQLYLCTTREYFQDSCTLLFIRRTFTLEKNSETQEAFVAGRLAFWDTSANKRLLAQPCYKPEGALFNRVEFPAAYFDRA